MTGIQGYPRIPTESEEQQMLMRWAAMAAACHRRSANGSTRSSGRGMPPTLRMDGSRRGR